MQAFEKVEIDNLTRISDVVDQLFEDVADRLAEVRSSVNDDIAVWPNTPSASERHIDFSEKMRRLASFHGDGVRNAVAWKRLRTAMDAWCALWFWPVEKAHLLPAKSTFIADIALVIEGKMGGQVTESNPAAATRGQGRLFETVTIPAKKGIGTLFSVEDRAPSHGRHDLFGEVDVDALIAASSWLPTAMEVAAKQRFTHFDLEFADVMRERGGFDLVIGNPPWMKPAWADPTILSEWMPEIALRGYKAARVDAEKGAFFKQFPNRVSEYLALYRSVGGLQSFVSSPGNFPFINGGNPNLYQCFIDLSFRLTSRQGIAALIHQDSHLQEPRFGSLRRECFRRLRRHYHFRNEIVQKMFSEVNHSEMYSANIYSGEASSVGFKHISTLFLPSTVDECHQHDGIGPVPGIRLNGSWDTRGHQKRCVEITEDVLMLMAALTSDQEGPPSDGGRFVYLHSTETLAVLRAMIGTRQIENSLAGGFQMTGMWNEGGVTKTKRIMKIGGEFVDGAPLLIMKSPCIFVGNPLYKCPDEDCSAKEQFEEIDLDVIPSDYLPRTNLISQISKEKLYSQSQGVPWGLGLQHVDFFRIALRAMVQSARERTLAAAMIPPSVHHVDSVESISFENESDLIAVYPLLLSLTHDFIIKAMQVQNIGSSVIKYLPYAEVDDTAKFRALQLCCLTDHYAPLWNRNAHLLHPMPWSFDDARLGPTDGSERWSPKVGIRNDFARRHALVEIDVLVAQALGLTLDQLVSMYTAHFPVLAENEDGTWYDANGRIVWTCSRGLPGAGFRKPDGRKPTAKEWVEIYADLAAGKTLECSVETNFLPGGPKVVKRTFVGPFERCNREADYRRAWKFFETQARKRAA
jgi:hypothetical protein